MAYGEAAAAGGNLVGQLYLNDVNNRANDARTHLANAQNHQEANTMRQYNADQAHVNRAFTESMSDTAHFREVRDLKNAGLNPILSATGGSGAPVGGGSAASAGPGAPSQAAMAPPIHMPDLMSYGVSLRQLEQTDRTLDQADKKLGVDTKTAGHYQKNLDADTRSKGRGAIRAEIENGVAEWVKNKIKNFKTPPSPSSKNFNTINQPPPAGMRRGMD